MVQDMGAAMELLAKELRELGLTVRNHQESPNGLHRMTVRNPQAAMLSETIIGARGSFWWSWRDRIAVAADVASAAAAIVRVLAHTESP